MVQPPLIFGEEDTENETYQEPSQKKHGQYYYVGVGLCVYAALAGAVSNVFGAKCNTEVEKVV